jgi:hypothetical protein
MQMDNSRNDSSSQTMSGKFGTYIPTLFLLLTALWLYNSLKIWSLNQKHEFKNLSAGITDPQNPG